MPDPSCSAPGCERPMSCKGLCDPHYRRLQRTGRVGGPIRQRINGDPERRFWPKVNKSGPVSTYRPDLGPCWLWTAEAQTANGYPQFRMGARMVLAHRAAWGFCVGPPPEGLQLDHLCRVKRCVNPAHLEPVTNQENAARAGIHWRHETCSQGHAMTDDNVRVNTNGRICRTCSPGVREDVAERCANGHERTPENTVVRISKTHGRSYRHTICRICACDATRAHRAKRLKLADSA